MRFLRFTAQSRVSIAVATLLAIYLTEKLVLSYRTLGPWTPRPTVLVVGEFEDAEAFAPSVLRGVSRRATVSVPSMAAPILVERVESSGALTDSTFSQRVLDLIASRRVVAIVSASTSANAPAILALARTFRLPVLVVVATADSILPAEHGHVIRLVPNDSRQGQQLTSWATRFERVLIIADETDYGRSLADNVTRGLETGEVDFLRVGISPATNLHAVLAGFQDWKPEGVIFAGYYRYVGDLLRTLRMLGLTPEVVLSDGCYSTRLPTIRSKYPGQVWISFPVNPFADSSESLSGFGVLGADAATAIRGGLAEADLRNTPRHELPDVLRSVLSSETVEPRTLNGRYSFRTDDGQYTTENLVGTFFITQVPNATNARPADATSVRPAPAGRSDL